MQVNSPFFGKYSISKRFWVCKTVDKYPEYTVFLRMFRKGLVLGYSKQTDKAYCAIMAL